MRGGAILDESFATFVRPERPIPAEITKLTRITEVNASDTPAFTEAFKTFAQFMGDGVLVADHNITEEISFFRPSKWLQSAAVSPCARRASSVPSIVRRCSGPMKTH